MAVALNKLFVSLGAALACSVTAQAAGYPDHPINMVVPFAAGGPTDNVARALAEAMRPVLGETIVVENKGGAGRYFPGRPRQAGRLQHPADAYRLFHRSVAV